MLGTYPDFDAFARSSVIPPLLPCLQSQVADITVKISSQLYQIEFIQHEATPIYAIEVQARGPCNGMTTTAESCQIDIKQYLIERLRYPSSSPMEKVADGLYQQFIELKTLYHWLNAQVDAEAAPAIVAAQKRIDDIEHEYAHGNALDSMGIISAAFVIADLEKYTLGLDNSMTQLGKELEQVIANKGCGIFKKKLQLPDNINAIVHFIDILQIIMANRLNRLKIFSTYFEAMRMAMREQIMESQAVLERIYNLHTYSSFWVRVASDNGKLDSLTLSRRATWRARPEIRGMVLDIGEQVNQLQAYSWEIAQQYMAAQTPLNPAPLEAAAASFAEVQKYIHRPGSETCHMTFKRSERTAPPPPSAPVAPPTPIRFRNARKPSDIERRAGSSIAPTSPAARARTCPIL